MTWSARVIASVALAAAALAACGGTGRSRPTNARPRSSGGGSHAALPNPSRTPLYRLTLPVSSDGPTTCTVFENDYGTQIVVDSETLDVRGQCFLWAANRPGAGYLWGYERAARLPAGLRLCSLTDPQRKLTASVIDVAPYVPGSAQRAKRLSVCAEIRTAGWTPLNRARSTRT